MNDYDELIEHCRNMYELGFGKMDAVADTLEQLANKCKSYEAAIKGLASMEHFYPDGTTFYITSENIIEKEVALRLKTVKQRDGRGI